MIRLQQNNTLSCQTVSLEGVRPHLSVFYQSVKTRPSFARVTDWKNRIRKGILMFLSLLPVPRYYFEILVRRDGFWAKRTKYWKMQSGESELLQFSVNDKTENFMYLYFLFQVDSLLSRRFLKSDFNPLIIFIDYNQCFRLRIKRSYYQKRKPLLPLDLTDKFPQTIL